MKTLLTGLFALLLCLPLSLQANEKENSTIFEKYSNLAKEKFSEMKKSLETFGLDKVGEAALDMAHATAGGGYGLAVGVKDTIVAPDSLCARMKKNKDKVISHPLFSDGTKKMIEREINKNNLEVITFVDDVQFLTRNLKELALGVQTPSDKVAQRIYDRVRSFSYRCVMQAGVRAKEKLVKEDVNEKNSFPYAYIHYLAMAQAAGYENAVNEGLNFANSLE